MQYFYFGGIEMILKTIFFFVKFINYWGPGVHIHFGNMVLIENKDEIKDLAIIKRNKDVFLYGTVSPDITLGKKYIKELEKQCHKWEVGFNVIKNAKNDREKVLGYGYISHLAADVIAHNFYLPKELLAGRGFRNFAHTIIEMKSDMMLYHDTYESIKNMSVKDYKDENEYLKNMIAKSVLPFGMNLKIFKYSLKTVKSRGFYGAMKFFTKYSEWENIKKELIKEYHDISYKLVLDVLIKHEDSMILKYDPNGRYHLDSIKELKKTYKLKELKKNINEFYNIPEELKIL